MDQYAVMGNPVEHSKSPAIHTAFAKLTRQKLKYSAIGVEEGQFEQSVNDFFDQGGKGLNVTVPFKEEAWRLASVHSRDAQIAGAVNTLFRDEAGRLHGHNTDGIGLVRDIKVNHYGELKGKRILILGAGGAARGILLPLLREEPFSICIANRTPERAEQLCATFAPHGQVESRALDQLGPPEFDWVINATSSSLKGEMLPLRESLITPTTCCYDLMYGKGDTIFSRWCRDAGAEKALDGLGMLVEQAAESYYLWRGILPDTAKVIASLRQEQKQDRKPEQNQFTVSGKSPDAGP